MRKLFIGCGILALLVFCLVVGAGIWGYMKVKAYHQGLVQVQNAYKATNQSYPFTPTSPPVMDAERFQTYLSVRAELARILGDETALLNRLEEASEGTAGKQPKFSFSDFKELLGLPKRVGDAHVKALEDAKMSVDEYLWHNRIVLGTVVKALKEGKELADSLEEAYGDITQSPRVVVPGRQGDTDMASMEQLLGVEDVPLLAENLELINEAKEELSKNPELISIDFFLRGMGFGSQGRTSMGGTRGQELPAEAR